MSSLTTDHWQAATTSLQNSCLGRFGDHIHDKGNCKEKDKDNGKDKNKGQPTTSSEPACKALTIK